SSARIDRRRRVVRDASAQTRRRAAGREWRVNCETVRAIMTIVSIALAALALQGSVLPRPSQEPVVAFVDVHVIPMNRAAGFDHLEIHEGLTRETYDTIVATAKRLGMRFAGHVPDSVGVYHALESGQASIDQLDNYVETAGGPDSADDRRIAQVVAATCA